MNSKSPKVHTLAQVGKLLGVGQSTVYNYIIAGLIRVLPRTPGKKEGRTVTDAEFQRLKRDGVNPAGLKAKLAKRGPVRAAAKKQAKRKTVAAAAAAKKQVKRKTAAAAAKKQVKRTAAAAARGVTKKQKRG